MISDDTSDTAGLIALRHVLWCAEQGMTPADVFNALYDSAPACPTWAKAVQACVVEYNAIKRRQIRRLWEASR